LNIDRIIFLSPDCWVL